VFPGCFAVQQTDTTAKVNTPDNIATAQSMSAVLAQVETNKKDLADAVAANQNAGTSEALANQQNVNQLLQISVVTKASAVETPAVLLGGNGAAAAAATTATTSAAQASSTAKASKNNSGKKNNNNNNNKRSDGLLRWSKRYVLPNTDFTEASP
jgi:hypothetical protein